MIPVGQPYRPAGGIEIRSTLVMLIFGAAVATLAAVPIWIWEISPIPTLVIVATAVQGLLVGWALAFVVGRLKVRNPGLARAIGIGCGLLSVALVHYGHYLRMASQAGRPMRRVIEEAKIPANEKRVLLDRLDANPASFLKPILVKKTGHGGFLGSLILRNQVGITITLKGHPVNGWLVWLIWGGEAALVASVAAAMASARASKVFCDDCRLWCERESDSVILPDAATDPLVEAIARDDPGRVIALRADPPADPGTGRVGVTLHFCPHCDQTFADVSRRVSDAKETHVSSLLNRVRISPEMAAACYKLTDPLERADQAVANEVTADGPDAG